MSKLKREEAGYLSKSERKKLQRLYTPDGVAYGSVRILMKPSNLWVSKFGQFLHSKPSYTKFTLATRKFKTMKAFVRFKFESGCMDLAYVDKLAKEDNGVMLLLVRRNLFDKIVAANGMKKKASKETVRAFFLDLITKNIRTKRFWVDKGLEFAGELKKLWESWRKTILLYNGCNQGCICWTYNTMPEKVFTVTWKIMDTSIFSNWLKSLQTWSPEKISR